MKRRAFVFLGFLTLFIPMGLLSQYPAWGEWEEEYYSKILGYIPKGIEEGGFSLAFIPDYSLQSLGDIGSYYLSAIVGIVLIFAIFYLLYRGFAKNAKSL